jgi:hypothetical protein
MLARLQVLKGAPNGWGRIHPDFLLGFGGFAQNRPWDRKTLGPQRIKVCFSFDDPTLLDDCPFVTKITVDLKTSCRFFGVAYGTWSDQEELIRWASRFPIAKLFTYDGEFLRIIVGTG